MIYSLRFVKLTALNFVYIRLLLNHPSQMFPMLFLSFYSHQNYSTWHLALWISRHHVDCRCDPQKPHRTLLSPMMRSLWERTSRNLTICMVFLMMNEYSTTGFLGTNFVLIFFWKKTFDYIKWFCHGSCHSANFGVHISDRQDLNVFHHLFFRARRISENVFGILANRFRVFLGAINLKPETATSVTMAAVTLDNLLRARNPLRYLPAVAVDQDNSDRTIRRGTWRDMPDQFLDLAPSTQRNATTAAKGVRRKLTDYFANVGAVPWQDRVLEVVKRRRTTN